MLIVWLVPVAKLIRNVKYSWYEIALNSHCIQKNFENNDKLLEQICQYTMGMVCSSEVRAAAAIAEDVGFDSLPCPPFSDLIRNWCPHHYCTYDSKAKYFKN